MTSAQTMLAELPEAEVIPLPVVGNIVGWDHAMRSYAVREGVIHPLPKAPGRKTYQLDRDEAVLIVIAAALALVAGIAVCSAIRAIRVSGLDPSAFIPKT